jgi:hypothetical protein
MSGFDNTSFTVRTSALTSETMTNQDSVVIFTAVTAKTCALPDATVIQPGRRYVVINTGAGAITVDPFGAQTINGVATIAVTASTGRADFITDGFNWFTVTAS